MKFDFSSFPLSNKEYGGSEKKIGILIENVPYMVKFQKNTPFGMRYNHVSEYIGSRIFKLLGFDCQDTYLGTYNNKNVVACKDFVTDGYQFVPFNDVGESTIDEDKEKYQYSYEDIITLLSKNKKITNVEETISLFFDVYIVDALIGNFDRHGANWGFLKKNNKYQLAPIFDNGSCLYPSLINEDEIKYIMNNEDEINNRIYKFPTSQIKVNNKKSSYFDVISSLQFKEVNESLKRIFPKIDLNKINLMINNIESISKLRKDFYILMINKRYEKILKLSYLKLMEKENEENRK